MTTSLSTKGLFAQESVQQRFEQLLGKKAPGFITSVLQTVNNSKLLEKADPTTVLNAAATAASLDLPINQSLGRAWIVPFKGQAQFQIGYKGFVELAQRSGKYKAINAIAVYENQYKGFNTLTEELEGDFSVDGSGAIVGFAAYFELLNGFRKTVFWSREKIENHAKRFSKSYNSPSSVWKTDFESMAKKTVLKHTLSNWGVLSIEMQTATIADQAIQPEEGAYQYADNVVDLDQISEEEETARVIKFLDKANDIEEVEMLEESLAGQEITENAKEAIELKKKELKN